MKFEMKFLYGGTFSEVKYSRNMAMLADLFTHHLGQQDYGPGVNAIEVNDKTLEVLWLS